jgi:ribosomal protein S18 acetylase RimI-like enzyme
MNTNSNHTGEPVILRPVTSQDDSFLFQVYASTRAAEMALVDWTEEQKALFLQMQFNAQRQHYRSFFPHAEYNLICLEDQHSIGRMIVNRSTGEILLMDIALLPGFRSMGIGSNLIKGLQNEAQEKGVPLRLHVESFNPALRLYDRLGFTRTRENGIYLEMEWLPSPGEPITNQEVEKDKADA